MAIEFHCEHCGKLVRTSDEHAGKRGKCPGCHQSVYIPSPGDQIELLSIAPLDESEEQRQKRLLDESRDLAQDLMRDREVPPESAAAPPPPPASLGDARLIKATVEEQLIQYAQRMAKGELAQAEELAVEIRKEMKVANEVIQRLTMDEIPPDDLGDIPRPVLLGFFRQLSEKQ